MSKCHYERKSSKKEKEFKFLCPEGVTPEVLKHKLKEMGLKVKWKKPKEQIDTYLDTPNDTLMKDGMSLRVRRIGDSYEGTFKTPESHSGALFLRGELKWSLSPEDVQIWERGGLPNFPKAVSKLFEVSSLSPKITVHTLRHKALVYVKNKNLIELAIDEVAFLGAKGKVNYRELELELKRGDDGQFKRIAKVLEKHFSLKPSTKSKYAIGREIAG